MEEDKQAAPAGVRSLRLGTTRRRLDGRAVKEGVRKECVFRPGLYVTILPGATFNPRYKAAISRATDDEQFRSRYDDPEFVRDALVASMDGISDEDGEPVPYTPEVGLAVLADPGNADVREWIVSQSLEYTHYYNEQLEADAKN
jgi:hypothetical protein